MLVGGVWVYLIKEKHEASQLVKDFCFMVNTQFDTKVKIIRSDNECEFISRPMEQFYKKQGIIHQISCIDTPQQNARAERKNRHLLNVARALRFQANLPLDLCGGCVLTATHLINRTPLVVFHGKTPYEVLYK